ncbi:MAG: histidine kinase dimerization/phosphoacceptor domain -containing protein [Verrucomicrobiota bacterium]
MLEFIRNLFTSDFMPHGHCYLWQPGIVWLHVISDSFIALAYYSIPLTLVYFVGKRRDLPYPWMFLMFGGFIVACGTTHLMEVWTVWHGTYRLAGTVKLLTALLSIGTAVLLVKILPEALALQSPLKLAQVNADLEREIQEREKAETELRRTQEDLESRVRGRTEELAQANATLQLEIAERKRIEEEVRRLNADLERRVIELQTLFDVMPIGIGIAEDRQCRRIRLNQAFAQMLKLPAGANASKSAPAEEIPRNFKICRHGLELSPDELPMQRAAARGEVIREFDEQVVHTDGATLHLLAYAAPLCDEKGAVRGSVGAFVDITDRRRAEEQVRASLREKEALLQEIHHRVKNNMQVVSSLLQLQSNYIRDPAALEMFTESQDRIKSMALIHEKLYQSRDLDQINFGDYMSTLVGMLARTYAARAGNVRLQVQAEPAALTVNTAIPLGLIVNELITNAFKHAFPGGRAGEISAELRGNRQNGFALLVRDNGVGVSPGFLPETADSLGLRLVRILSEQIGAQVEYHSLDGLHVKLTFTDKK